jgi:hypothetical protein
MEGADAPKTEEPAADEDPMKALEEAAKQGEKSQ